MDKLKVAPNLDFGDSSFRSCEMDGDQLIIYLNSWDGKILKLEFPNVLLHTFAISDAIEGLYEKRGASDLLDKAIALFYEQIPKSHPFKHYEILDIYDEPMFQIISEDMHAIKED